MDYNKKLNKFGINIKDMTKKRDLTVWDYIAWAVLIGIIVWLILKMSGALNTPLLVEYAPYFGGVYLAGWAMHKLERATEDIKEVKGKIESIEKNVSNVELDMNLIRKKCPALIKSKKCSKI